MYLALIKFMIVYKMMHMDEYLIFKTNWGFSIEFLEVYVSPD